MAMMVPCRRCGAELTGADEDALFAVVLRHIREVHNSLHEPDRQHLLTRAVQVPDRPK